MTGRRWEVTLTWFLIKRYVSRLGAGQTPKPPETGPPPDIPPGWESLGHPLRRSLGKAFTSPGGGGGGGAKCKCQQEGPERNSALGRKVGSLGASEGGGAVQMSVGVGERLFAKKAPAIRGAPAPEAAFKEYVRGIHGWLQICKKGPDPDPRSGDRAGIVQRCGADKGRAQTARIFFGFIHSP